MISSLILILVLMACSAFFSGSETSVMSASRSKIHKLKTDGNKSAEILSLLRGKDKERFLGSILLGNNFVNILASAVATSICIDLFGDSGEALAIATAIMTALILIYCEVLPKTLAVRNAENIALKVAGICFYLTKILYPFTYVVKFFVDKSIKLMRIQNAAEHSVSGLEVIKGAIDLHHEEGEVFTEDKFMLGGLIDLESVTVEEIMIYRNDIYGIDIDDDPEDLILSMMRGRHSRIPVWEKNQDNIIGILYLRDILQILKDKKVNKVEKSDLRAILREPWFIPSTTNLKTQLRAFREKHRHFALVVDEYGELLGLVTLEDIVEEIVGQIDDEYDFAANNDIKKIDNKTLKVSGDVTIRDINREMEWDISDEDATTIGGLILHIARAVPSRGEEFTHKDYVFKMLKKKRNTILKIKITKVEKNV